MLFKAVAEIRGDTAATFSHGALIHLPVLLPVSTGTLNSFTNQSYKAYHTSIGDLVGKYWRRWLG
jgi:hypothetical protein